MLNQLKKGSYFLAVLFVSLLLILLYNLFFASKPATPNHSVLTLKPYTESEQRDLISAQEQDESSIESGPLVAKMNVTDAEARVLNVGQKNKVKTN